ncbi:MULTISPECIES: hypothetical protein [Cupriavidus]
MAKKLSRQQLKDVAQLRGLSMETLVARTGVPMASLIAMMSGGENDKDPSKLLSQETYERILDLIGVSADNTALASKQVRLWTHPAKNPAEWRGSFGSVKKSLFPENSVVLAEVVTRKRLFARARRLVLMHDSRDDVQVDIVIAGVTDSFSQELQSHFQTQYAHKVQLSDKDFDMFLSLVDNNACSHAQFRGMLGGGTLRYSWTDVQAAAQQFNLQPDDLIAMISERVAAAPALTLTVQEPAQQGALPKLVVVDSDPRLAVEPALMPISSQESEDLARGQQFFNRRFATM